MDFKKLQTFRVAAQTSSFSETGKRLGYVQSAVTTQIKALEEELATQLFDRNGRGVILTPAGRQLLTYAEKLLALRDEALDVVRQGERVTGTVHIAGYETVLTYRLPLILGAFLERYPEVRLVIRPLPVRALKKSLVDAEIDLVFFLEETFSIPDITTSPIRAEQVVLIAAPQHPLAHQRSITANHLVDETLLLTEQGCNYRNLFERTLIRAGAMTGPRLEFSSIEAIKACVKLGTGIAAISRVSVARELETGELVALDWADDDLSVPLLLAWNKRKWQPPAVKALIEMCTQQL